MELDVTAPTNALAEAATNLVRLLPGRLIDPVLAGVILKATPEGVTIAGTDRERGIQVSRSARTHAEGSALVPAKLLADTLRSLDTEEVRLVVEGHKLALRTPQARFALPMLDIAAHPGVRSAPPLMGSLDAALLPRASIVASAASKDDALPVFTGVHARQSEDRLVLVATDRFRMAVASLPWRSQTSELDILIPASLITEVVRQASGEVGLHADKDRIGMSYAGTEVTTTLLDASFPDESRHLTQDVDCTVEVNAEELAGAVRRVAHYAGSQGAVLLDTGGSEIRVRAGDPQLGEAEEAVKATVHGDRFTPAYQPRYLIDALQAFAGRQTLRLSLRSGARRSSVFSAVEPDPHGVDLRYVLMPKRV